MPGFELEQVDGGSPINIPDGDTVLGRGPFLGVNDKRVSRNHCILENKNGQLRLKPTHLNPCFIQTNIVASPQPLEKDQWHWLKEGDIFSLMPWKYVYRVRLKEEDQTLRNSQAFDEAMEVKKCSTGPAELSVDAATTSPSCTLSGDKSASSHTLCSLPEVHTKTQHDESDRPQKKRILPAWMMTSASTSPSTSKAVRGTPTKAKRVAAPKPGTGPSRARAAQLSSEEEEPEEEKPKRKTKRLKSDSEDESVPLVSLDDVAAPRTSRVRTVPDGENSTGLMERDDGEMKGDEVGRGAQAEDDSQASQGPSQRSKITEAESKTSVSKVKKQRRTRCAYGSSCYRKNQLHFQECSHPGDSDYEEEEEEDADDDRPECPYGTHCYRKNPLHKKEYKHTKSPPKTVAAADDDDEDRYENSFINDESEEEEVDEDSDYVPESDDSGKGEDFKRLQKEAKAFLRRKK
ncbi:aprataxin and PNK-like factor [Pimephales promelas]|uniref:aprataxin and PNK-like factor n=1 Tax=Pimephales promelas TaxID=90988 RepID=UPI0019556366|nr:aprataxin and PNK-like factor [Pimephales promelas]XP_039542452.1 aprataxin and PNK-like factor [Pimephales promelas]XP_039542462.1 aprataxin and PNK-like factor [Pimephales promelas]KAG1956127.1 aprataxin and PNK-like factor [Pimephales promelas]